MLSTMLKRKAEKALESFYSDNGSYALLITGARQVGKTFLVEQFAKSHYDSFVEINFIRDASAKRIFENVKDVSDVLFRISMFANGKLKGGRTLIFFDEVQKCPEAVTYIKFLVQESNYNYILSGSLLGVELKNVRSVPVGFMRETQMFPLDFEEFLWANGVNDKVIAKAREAFEDRKAVDSFLHDLLMRYFRLYLVVGGMPAVVSEYLESNDFGRVTSVQKSIVVEYRRDISQYDAEQSLHIRDIYDRLPSELNQQNKRFSFGSVLKNGRFDALEDGVLWLIGAGVAITSYCVDEPKAPLELSRKRNLFKLFANDVGVLASMYMNGIQLKLLNNEMSINIGSIYENVVAQELVAHGFSPNYFNSKKQGELDFVIERDGHAMPMEVKSGKDYKRHSALNNVLADANYQIQEAFVLNNENVQKEGKITYLPIYMAMFIEPVKLPEKFIYKVSSNCSEGKGRNAAPTGPN